MTDRRTTLGLAATSLMCLATIVIVVITLLVGTDTNSDVNNGVRLLAKQQQSQEITSCRASCKAELVDAPTAQGLKALSVYGAESPEFRAAALSIDDGRYTVLVNLAQEDPVKFLKGCRNPLTTCQEIGAPVGKDEPSILQGT